MHSTTFLVGRSSPCRDVFARSLIAVDNGLWHCGMPMFFELAVEWSVGSLTLLAVYGKLSSKEKALLLEEANRSLLPDFESEPREKLSEASFPGLSSEKLRLKDRSDVKLPSTDREEGLLIAFMFANLDTHTTVSRARTIFFCDFEELTAASYKVI